MSSQKSSCSLYEFLFKITRGWTGFTRREPLKVTRGWTGFTRREPLKVTRGWSGLTRRELLKVARGWAGFTRREPLRVIRAGFYRCFLLPNQQCQKTQSTDISLGKSCTGSHSFLIHQQLVIEGMTKPSLAV